MQRALEIVLTLVMAGLALDFGGVQPLAYSLAEVVLFGAVLVLCFRRSREEKLDLTLPPWPLLFLAVVALQLVPLPSSLVTSLSSARRLDPLSAGIAGIETGWSTISIYPHDTILMGIKMLAYLSAFLLAAYLFDSRRRKSILVAALVGLGTFEAAYGTVQYLTGWQRIFTYKKVHYTELATGTYINHDHFASLLELTFPFAFGLAFYFFQIWSEAQLGSRQSRMRNAGTAAGSSGLQSAFYLFLVAIMIVGVGFSISRGGILAAVVSILSMAFLALARLRTGKKAWLVGVFLLVVCIGAYAVWIGVDKVLIRFEQMHESNYLQMEGRIVTWRDTLRLIRDYPLLGSGLGTFGLAFRRYQTGMVNYFFEHTHNDYLEFASDTGLIGAALLFLPILYLLIRMTVAFFKDARRYRSAVTLGCIGATLGIMIHSAMDFNLQIPANALVLAVVLGIGYKAACVEPRAESRSPVAGWQVRRPTTAAVQARRA